MDDNLTKKQKRKAIEDYKNGQEKQYKSGEIIVTTIAIFHIILGIISFFIDFNIIALFVRIFKSIALYMGVSWVRYLFVIGAGLSVILSLVVIFPTISGFPMWAIIFNIVNLVYNIASCILLFANKGVSEFLYAQKN